MSSNAVSNEQSHSRIGKSIREIIAAAFWMFAFIKLFVADVDLLVISRLAPRFLPYLQLRFFAILSFVALSWIILGNRKFRGSVAYVLFYPLVVLFWHLPRFCFKNWPTAIVFAPAIHSIITTFKWRFIAGTLTMVAALTILMSSSRYVLEIAMIVLCVYLISHYAFRFRAAFRASTSFASLGGKVGTAWETLLKSFREKEMQEMAKLPPESDEFQKKHAANLQLLLLYTLGLKSIARKLQTVFESRKTDLYFLSALVYSFVLTLVLFAFEYFALYKVQPDSFGAPVAQSFWTFLVFSFNVILHAGFTSLAPHSRIALLLANSELLAGIMIFVVFVFVLLTSNRERFRQDLRAAIDKIEEGASHMGAYMQKEFKLNILEAEIAILKVNPGFSQFIVWFGETPPAVSVSGSTSTGTAGVIDVKSTS